MSDFGMPYLLETPRVTDCVQLCQELGLRFVELNASFPACLPEQLDARALRRITAETGVYFTLHADESCDPFFFHPTIRAAWQQALRMALRLAVAAEMPVVNMHLPRGVYVTLPEKKVFLYAQEENAYLDAVLALRRLCEEELQGSVTRVAVENTNGFQPHEQKALELLLASPVFGLTLDIGHCHAIRNADEPFYRAHADRLMHMHGHDALGKRNHLPLGEGEIDLRERFAWAARNHARVVLEIKTVAALKLSVARLPQYVGEAVETTDVQREKQAAQRG